MHQRRAGAGERRVRTRAERRGRNGDVDACAQNHRADDTDGEIARRVDSLLGRGRYGIEAIESEENQRRRREHAAFDAVRVDMGAVAEGCKRMKARGIEGGRREHDEQHQRGNLDAHQDEIDVGALARADDEEHGDYGADRDCRQIQYAAGE